MMETWLPHKLRTLRVRQGLTLIEAAKKTGVTRATLSELERGHRHPVAPTLLKIAKGYEIPVEQLLEEPLPLGEAPEAGPATDRGHLPPSTREVPEEAEISEADRRYLSALLDPWTKLFQGLNETYGPFLRIKLPDAPSDEELRRIYSWLAAFVEVCNRMDRMVDDPAFSAVVNPLFSRMNDETVPADLRKKLRDFDDASRELFDNLVPLAEDWMIAQGKRATDKMMDELTADIGHYLKTHDKPRRGRS